MHVYFVFRRLCTVVQFFPCYFVLSRICNAKIFETDLRLSKTRRTAPMSIYGAPWANPPNPVSICWIGYASVCRFGPPGSLSLSGTFFKKNTFILTL